MTVYPAVGFLTRIIFLLTSCCNATTHPGGGSSAAIQHEHADKVMGTILPALISAVLAIGILIILVCFCSDFFDPGEAIHYPPVLQQLHSGLDPAEIDTFPLFEYSQAEDLEIGTMVDCTVCLGEFEEEETLRLLPKCNHVFHQQCIDSWLATHVTCPVCRAILSPETDTDSRQRTIVQVR